MKKIKQTSHLLRAHLWFGLYSVIQTKPLMEFRIVIPSSIKIPTKCVLFKTRKSVTLKRRTILALIFTLHNRNVI